MQWAWQGAVVRCILEAIETFYQILIMQNEGEKAIKPNVPKRSHPANY